MKRTLSKLRLTLRASAFDGSFHAAMVGFGETYFAAFALVLGASAFQAGLVATLPMLVGSLFQPAAPRLAGRVGPKRWLTASAALQGLIFLPVVLLAVVTPSPRSGFAILMGLVCLYWALGLGVNAVWSAWIGSLVPPRIRSRFFARRTVPIQATLFIAMVTGGGVVHFSNSRFDRAAMGFGAIFLAAGVCRLISAFYLWRHRDAPWKVRMPRLGTAVFADITTSPQRPYHKLILLAVLMSGSVHVAAPYFTPFMLEDLRLSYATFTLLNAAVALSRVVSASYWGEIARAYGNRRAMQVSALLIVPLPALWLVSGDPRYLFALQLVAGFAWAGYELTLFLNFFDCTDERNRARVLSLYNLFNGVSVVAGTLIGGLLLRELGADGYQSVFFASAVLRALAVLFFARGTGVRRPGEHSFENVLLRVVSFRPGQGPRLRPAIMPDPQPRRWRRRRGEGRRHSHHGGAGNGEISQ